MADDNQKRGPADRSRINIHEGYELQDWADSLGVTNAELLAAVEHVGDKVSDVKAFLKRK